MKNPWSIIFSVLKNYWDEMFNLMLCNLLWLVAQLFVISGPPATAALFYVTNGTAKGGFAKLTDFVGAFRRFFWESWKWGIINVVVILTLGYALLYYSSGELPGPFGFWLAVLTLLFLAEWLFIQMFAFPFWLEQDNKQMRLALRNAVILQAQNLPLMMLVALIVLILLGVSTLIPVLVALGVIAFLMMLGNAIVVEKVQELRGEGENSVWGTDNTGATSE